MMTQQHVDALTWASWGFEIIPLTIKKTPYVKGAFHVATSDTDQINKWWNRWPHANIGARPFPGHAVIDIDPRHGGTDTFNELKRGHFLPATLTTRTGSGGLHYWFKLPEDRPTKHVNAAPGIDIKTHKNGYAVMPGSIHPKTRKRYTCLRFMEPVMLPPYLRNLVYKPKPVPRPVIDLDTRLDNTSGLERYLVAKVATAAEGTRHTMLMEACFSAHRECPHIIEDLVAAARATGLPEGEIDRVVASTYESTRGEGRLAA